MTILLRTDKANLRIHGNGFLQAETGGSGKIHVWDRRLPKQETSTALHNHNHGFISRVLIGGIHMVEYTLWNPPIGDHTWYIPHQCIPREGKDTRLEPSSDYLVAVTNRRDFWLEAGSEYTFPLNMNLYHQVEPIWNGEEMIITAVQGIDHIANESELPTVLVREGCEPDNDFDRYGFYDIACEVYEDAMTLMCERKLGFRG